MNNGNGQADVIIIAESMEEEDDNMELSDLSSEYDVQDGNDIKDDIENCNEFWNGKDFGITTTLQGLTLLAPIPLLLHTQASTRAKTEYQTFEI